MTKRLIMMQLTGIAASNQLTFSPVEGVATMETAGVRGDSWHPHAIANHESRSHGFHISKDLLFFYHSQKNIPQLMQKSEALLYRPAVQCLLYCAVAEWAVVPYVDTSASREMACIA
jgi:hypothetical protein